MSSQSRSASSSPPNVKQEIKKRRIRISRPRLTSHLSGFRHGSSGRSALLSPTATERQSSLLGVLAVRVYAARNLEPKDKHGKSDPFFFLRAGSLRVRSDVVKASLNPVYGDLPDDVRFHAKDGYSRNKVHVEVPIHATHVERQHIEVIFWDKDRLTKNDYLGEVSLGLEDWFGGALQQNVHAEDIPVSFADPRNTPKWYPLKSSKARAHVQGEVLVRVGFVPHSPNELDPQAENHQAHPIDVRLSEDKERQLAELFLSLYHHAEPASATERALTAPPTQGVGTLLSEELAGRRLSLGVGMGDPDASDASDNETEASLSGTEDDEGESDEDEETDGTFTPFDENYTISAPPEDMADPLAAAGARLAAHSSTASSDASASVSSLQLPLSDALSAATTPGGSRKGLSLPHFMKRTPSSKSVSSIRSTASQKGANVLNRMRHRSSNLDISDVMPASEVSPSPRKRRIRRRRTRPMTRVGTTLGSGKTGAYELQGDNDIIGICFVEIVSAHDLPRWKNMTRTTFDMDPFVIASFAQKIFRTRVVRHSLDPTWQERLFFHVKRHEATFGISFSCFDWDKVSANDFIGEVTLDMATLMERAPKPDEKTHLFAHKNGQILGDQLHEFRLALVPARTEELDSKKPCEITVKAKFTPYAALRQQFWRRYLQQYDTDDSGEFSDLEAFSMLDSLGSTLSYETRQSFFTRFGKTDADTLTADELIACLEQEMHKPQSERNFVDKVSVRTSPTGLEISAPESDSFAKPASEPSLGDNAFDDAGIGFTGALRGEEHANGREPDIEPARVLSPPSRSQSRADSTDTDLMDDQIIERVINIKTCPLCHRPRLTKRSEIDIVTHLALCASQDWSTVGTLLTGSFVTVSQAHRKWLTKMISKVSNGSYELGANSANIIVQNRMTGQLQEEKMQIYVRLGIRLLYKGFGSNRMEGARIRRMLESMSVKQGLKYDAPESARDIKPFIAFHKLDMDEILEPLSAFKNFNQFFYRKLKPDARPPAEPDNPNILVSSADCRMMAFATVDDATRIWIKGREFSVARLLGDSFAADAKHYEGGALCIFRLAPQDYHRYHSPVDGVVGQTSTISGQYYTVNPMAIRSAIDVYGDNVREIVPIDSPQFGRVYNACIGAMMVGSIKLTVKPGDHVKRAQEYGYFAFGGSTIVSLFPPDTVQFDSDLLENSSRAIETLVRVGMRIGVRA